MSDTPDDTTPADDDSSDGSDSADTGSSGDGGQAARDLARQQELERQVKELAAQVREGADKRKQGRDQAETAQEQLDAIRTELVEERRKNAATAAKAKRPEIVVAVLSHRGAHTPAEIADALDALKKEAPDLFTKPKPGAGSPDGSGTETTGAKPRTLTDELKERLGI